MTLFDGAVERLGVTKQDEYDRDFVATQATENPASRQSRRRKRKIWIAETIPSFDVKVGTRRSR